MRTADGGPNGRLRLVLGGAAAVVVVVAVLVVVLGGGGHGSDGGGSPASPGNASTGPPVTSTAGRGTSTAGRGTSTAGRGTSTAARATSTSAPAPSGPAPLGPPAQPAPASEQFGISVNRLFNDQFAGHGYTPGQIDDQLTELAATGATLARSDTLWSAAEPSPPGAAGHRYDWAFDDQIAGALAAHGLQWLPIVDYAPGWAATVTSSSVSPPRLVGDYAAFAGAFASRYGPGGSFWRAHPGLRAAPVDTYEVWNEPDNAQFWPPAPSATTYADMYLRARDAITAADPSARVIVGGLTNPGVFLPALAAARPGFFAHVDGVAIHPYGPTPAVVYGRVRGARSVLTALGPASMPLYVTEFGWTTLPPHSLGWAPARVRPSYISRTLSVLGHTDCGLAAAILYTWVTPELNPADHEDWYGISPPGRGGPSASVSAFATGLRAARASGAVVPVCSGG